MTTETSGDTIGLVLAGGGARGAYENGVLSRLLPALGKDAHWVRIVAGTSIGSVNAAYLCSRADEWMRPVASTRRGGDGKWRQALRKVLDDAEDLWRTLEFNEVTGGLPRSGVKTVTSFLGDLVNLSEFRSLLDSARLEKTLAKRIELPRLNAHVGGGSGYGVEALAIAATSTATSRTTIFHKRGRPPAADDDKRGIDYVPIGEVAPVHVRASSAIPIVFPPVQVSDPGGGVRRRVHAFEHIAQARAVAWRQASDHHRAQRDTRAA